MTTALGAAAVLALAACGSSGSRTTASPAAGNAASPGTSISAVNVSGLGMVLVDGRGHTVYLLTSGDHTNVPCEDSTGCTKVWPDLPLPAGTATATAGAGVQPSMLSTMKLSDGSTYPTYNGWLMYEYAGDSGSAQGHGEGIQSFGGTWYAINPSGNPVTAASSSTPTTARSGNGY
jgi:predicted lipoprotein with Yx(FWY)xxD motif